MNIETATPEQLKALVTLSQQHANMITAHHRSSTALAQFEVDIANRDKEIYLSPKKEKRVRKALKHSVRVAAEGVKSLGSFGLVQGV